MAPSLLGDSRRKYSWWWDSHISPKNSKWLQENLTDMDRNVKPMIKLIEEDADSFAKRAEMYYKKRPELMKIVEEFYRAYRALAERYDNATGALRQAHKTMTEAFPNQVPPVMSDESPSSVSDFYPSSPEMLSPIRGMLDFDDSSSKKGLKQLKEMFPFSDEKVRKTLSFKEEEGFKSEIKRLQEDISQLSSKNENLMKEMCLESQRAQALQDAVCGLETGKQDAIFLYKNTIERISVLETGIFNMRCELTEVNDQMTAKLNGVEEQVHAMESVSRSLRLKLEIQQKELDKKALELEELSVVIENEREKRMQAEVALTSLEQIHTHSQEETERLCLEVQCCTEKLKDMEASKAVLEERISEHDTIISNLQEQNLSDDAKIKEMQNEMQQLKDTKEKLEFESSLNTENNKALQKEVNSLENSLSSANVEIEGLKVSSHALEVFCETLVSEISTHSVEKGVWISHMESISDHMESLEVKNSLLEHSFSDTNTELENLRARFKDMEESCMSLCDQNSSLLLEKNNLVFQVENLDCKYSKLQNQYSDLEKERDSKTHELLDLQSSLRQEKQEHDAVVWSMSNQLEFLSNQISHLKAVFEMEQHKFMNSSLECFILQNCLHDMKDEHLFLFGEYQSVLEASKRTENQLSRLSHAEVILKREITLLMERNEELSEGFHLLMDALKIGAQNRSLDKGLVQFILDEIRNILNSVTKLRDENGKLRLKAANLDNQYLELLDKHSNLMREKDAMSHQHVELQNSSTQEKEYHENLVSKLKEEISCSAENIDMEQQNVMNYLFEVFILQRCLYDMKDTNLFLLREQHDILEEYKSAKNQIVELKDKELFQISEMETLSASNAVLCRGIHLLQKELNIDVNDMNTKGTSNEITLQNIFWEVKNMKSTVSLFKDENKQLHLKVDDLENQHLELVDKHSNLTREKDAMSHQLIELQNLLIQEKEHYDDIVSKLNEEINRSTESIELEQQKVMNSLFDIFVLQRCLCDMKETNLSLLGEKLDILEEYKSAKNQIVELENKENLQISEIETLSVGNAVLHKGVHMLLEELNIDVDGMNTKGSSNEMILQNICGEIFFLKNSVSNFRNENKQLHLKVEKLDNQYLELLDRHSTLTTEKDAISHRLIELENSFIEEKEHYENLVSKLKEEINCSAKNIEMEQQKVVNYNFEVFVLQRSLCDMNDTNLSLLGERNDILEEYRRAKDDIVELKNMELLQISEIETLSTDSAVLWKNIHLLLEELNIDVNSMNTKGTNDEMTLQNIFGEIKNLKNSLSNFQDENKQLHFKVENLDSHFLELLDKHSNLQRERDAISHQLLGLQTSLIQQKEQHEILVSTLNEEINHSVENIEVEQQKVMHSLFENFVLQRYLCDMKDTNLCLLAERYDILEASKRAEILITELKNKELSQTSEMDTLSKYNVVLQQGIQLLLEELNAGAKDINIESAAKGTTLQNILGVIKNLKVSVSEFRDENKLLLLKINTLERNLLDLHEKHANLKKENHFLQNHVQLLRKEYQDIDGDYEKEQEKTTNADIKFLVLQECIYDMGVKNIFLSDKCDHEDLIHKKELTLIFEALKIVTQNVTMAVPINKVTLQTILSRIKSLASYISDVHDENQCLGMEKMVSETILNQVRLDKLHLFNELECRTLELYSSESRRKELIEMNEELKVENDNFLSQIEVLRESMKILETKCLELEDKRSVLTIENEELESSLKSIEDKRCVLKIENEELENSLKSLVDKHRALILSSETQLAYLETQLYQLQKEMINKEEELCNESERLHLKVSILITVLKQISLDKLQLYRELENHMEKILDYESENFALMKTNEQLKVERNFLASEVKSIGHDFEILNRQYSELVEKIMNLEKENEDLVKSLKLEMQGHNALISSSKSHISSLENQVDLVQKGRMSLEVELLTGQRKTMSALLENFVLQRCLLDIKETNLTLSRDYQNLLEASRSSDKLISELKHEHESQTIGLLYTRNQKNDAEKMNQKLNTEIELLNKELRELYDSCKNLESEVCKLREEKLFTSVKLEALGTENSTILAEAMKLEQLYIFFKSLSIERGFKLKLASNLAKDLHKKFETEKNILTQKEMEISEFQKEQKKLYENLVASNSVKKELESEIKALSSRLSSKDELMIKYEEEIKTLLSDCSTSVLNASVFEDKVYELVEECERLDFLSILHKEKLREHISLINVLEKKLESLGRENGELKAELKSSYDAIACTKERMISLAEFSGMQDDRPVASTAEGIYDPHKLIIKTKLLQKAIEDTQHLLELERLDSKAKIESLIKEIEELKLKKSPFQEFSKEKYAQNIKDIQLDQASRLYKASNNESDDQMLELWEENTGEDIVEEIKSEYPSCELSVDKPETFTRVHENESPRAWSKICNEKLNSDLKKLLMIQKSLQDLRIKLESLEKKKHLKSVEYSALKEHIKDAEVAILEQVDIYGTLKRKVEENFESSNAVIWEKERRLISEKARKGLVKIGKLESEIQKIEYLVLKVQEEEENKRKLYLERKSSSTLLSEFIYSEDEVKGKKKGRFCGCVRPKTKS